MYRISHTWLAPVLVIAGTLSQAAAVPPSTAKSVATVESVKVSSTANGASIEIGTSQPVALRSQVITGPDRIILDFPNAQPAGDLRTKLLNQGDVKGFRVARYSENPPTTRVVIDLNNPQHYQIFPDGKTVIVKLIADSQQSAATPHLDNVAFTPPPPPKPKVVVDFKNGRLSISAERASLDEILNEVRHQTGTDITIPPGAGQEQIIANVGPLPIREALVSLLNGSRFNFIMVDDEHEPGKLKSVILTYRSSGGASQPAITAPEPAANQGEPQPEPPPPDAQPDMQAPPDAPPPPENQPPPENPPNL
jgi:hypothetical protein